MTRIRAALLIVALVSMNFLGILFLIPENVEAVEYVSGSIAVDTTWTLASGPYIVIDNVTVESGVNLTIEPGVEVKFNGSFSLIVNGTLNATGTFGLPINFTSNQSFPSEGDWLGIRLMGKNNTLNYCQFSYGDNPLYINGSNTNNIISNCRIFNNTGDGIHLNNTTNNTLINVTVSFSNENGITVLSSENNIIRNSNITQNNGSGIYFNSSKNNIIENSNISYNEGDAICLVQTIESTFRNNILFDNNGTGINLTYYSSNNTIKMNNITSNNETGIIITDNSNSNVISRNNISLNTNDGINITDSIDNLIHHNNFDSNGQNAYDSTNQLNSWDNGKEGNWWSDYAGSDGDGDGIGDTPHDIPGGGSKDFYPLVDPVNITVPIIENTTPDDGAENVSVTPQISITFSNEMNKTATENATSMSGGVTPTNFVWSNGNKTMTFEPDLTLDSETTYTVNVSTDAKDLLGDPLQLEYQFSFTTGDSIAPEITLTSPADGEIDILINADVIVTFNETMNTTSVTYTCSPDPGGWSVIWSGGNTTATYSHNDFASETTYTFNITGGKDLAGNDLAAGSVPNPWSFTTEDVIGPEISSTSPSDGATDVLITADVVVTFNEEMNTSTVTYTCTPDPGGWSVVWSGGNTTATYSHNDFASETIYTFNITAGKDVAGNDLVAGAVPNPWSFTTEDVVAPEISSTSPSDGAIDVLITADVVVTFTEEMNTSTVTYTCTPDPGGWSVVWSGGNTTATYSHNDFASETTYTFNITGAKDMAGNDLAAGAVPNPWSFTTEDVVGPEISSTSPSDGAIDVLVTADVVVTFNEEMNTSTVTYTCSPDPGGWSVVWSGGNTTATYSHNDFASKTTYTFNITAGKDITGNDLVAGVVPNPWTFTTEDVVPPEISSTTPSNGATDVLVTADVVVTFNEEMNTSSVTFTCTPDPGGWSVVWSGGNTTATYSHNDFASETTYTFNITGGKDMAGNNLVAGVVPNPWSFTTEDIIGPEISSTSPSDGATDVLITADVVVTFNEEMNTSTVTYTCSPDPGGWSVVWSGGNTTATYSHNDFASETTYTFNITGGKDVAGNDLVAGVVPNPWSFTTEDIIGPEISSTIPSDAAIDVLITADIVVTFSEEMNTSTVTYTCNPDPGGWSVVWSGGNTTATYSHNDFASETTYTFNITGGKDVAGNDLVAGAVPNPWSFTTEDIIGPEISSTIPSDAAIDVLITADIVVTFSEEMNTSTVTYTCNPDPGGWSVVWSGGNTTATYSHNDFASETTYTFNITGGKDVAGNDLVAGAVPNPWSFTTEDVVAPEISSTSPSDGAVDVLITADIVVTFNEEMNTSTVTYTCTPDPGGWGVVWSGGNTTATYSHNDFASETTYNFNITGAKDVAGNDLVAGAVPNPWSFTTEDVIGPEISSTSPSDGAIDVLITADIIVTFSEEMNTSTVLYTCSPDPGGWSVVWSGGNTTASYSHNDFASETIYTFNITAGKDLAGNDMVAGAVPNPWSFTTEDVVAPEISTTSPTDGAIDVLITADIVVTFNEEMNTTTVTYTCTPDPGGWSVVWSGGNTMATYSHNDFASETAYTFNITGGKDVAGNDLVAGAVQNPWSFTTEDVIPPEITITSPSNGATDVVLSADVVVTFSEEMNTSSVTYTCTPDPGGWSVIWSGGNTIATYSHNSFASNTTYTFEITGAKDPADNDLVSGAIPNPWSFTTEDIIEPEIDSTIPSNGATDILITADVVVTFSEEMNTSSVTYTCLPDPGGWSVVWSADNTTITYSHNDFASETIYSFGITGAKDLAGNDLVGGAVPNPWSFTTEDVIGPEISSTSPTDGAIDVLITSDIVVTFNEEMNKSTVTYTCTPDPGGWSVVWSGGNTTATYPHNDFTSETSYTFNITWGKDIAGNDLIAGMVPNPWSFSTEDAEKPTIISTSPANGNLNVAQTANVIVTFTEAMNTSSVNYVCFPNPGGWFVSWSSGDTVATFSHNPFDSYTTYTFQITDGKDLADNNLAPGAVPNPWSFTTIDSISPTITTTSPSNGSVNVGLTQNVIVTFSEAMNTSSLSYDCFPDPGGWTVSWSSGDTVVTFSHDAFDDSTAHTFQIPNVMDVAGNFLTGGAVPNPWIFTTIDATSPTIIAASPSNTSQDIALTANVVVTFSEEMNTATVTYLCTPDPGGWSASWNVQFTTVTYSHNAFDEMTTYTFQIVTGEDVTGNDLSAGAVPNPWSFTTEDVTAPTISATTPSDGSPSIALDQDVVVTFSESMDNTTVTYTCLPDPGSWSVLWNGVNTMVTFSHNPFDSNTAYTFHITGGKDLQGNDLSSGTVPNPWSFSTVESIPPTITLTSPSNGTLDVDLMLNVTVTFSEAMNTSSVAYTCSPDPGGWSLTWSAGNTVATFSHDKFEKSTDYTFHILGGKDIAGNNLIADSVPNPWSFTTLANAPPTILSSPILTATEDIQYNYDVEAVDGDEDILTYTLTTYPTGMSINSSTGQIIWTPTNSQVGANSVVVLVSDVDFGTDSQSFTITVMNVNDPPTITSTPMTTATEDVQYTYDVDASDIDGDSLNYSLSTYPSGMMIDIVSGLITWTPINSHVGDNSVVVLVSDGNGGTDTQSFTIFVENINDAPTIISVPITTATEDELYVYDVDATDADVGDTLTYNLAAYPTGMMINSTTGVIEWTPTNAQLGINSITVFVSDENGSNDTQSFTITVMNVNDAPTIVSTPITTAIEDTQYTYDVEAEDIDVGDTLSYSLSTYPSGMTIDSATGLILWTPVNGQVGANNVVVLVSDGNTSDTQSFTITVANTNDAPTITSTPITTATDDIQYIYIVEASDVDVGDALTFSLTAYPTGMTINTTTGVIEWTPNDDHVGMNSVTVLVSDGNGGTDTQSYSISVADANDPPTIISTALTTATEDVQYSYDVEAQDPDDDILNYSLTTSPNGMTIDNATGLILWTPINDQVGTNNVVVRILDGNGGTDTQSFIITVTNVNDLPIITSTPNTTAREDSVYSYDVEASDVDVGDTLTYSLTKSPAGMTIDPATGVILWTPTNDQVGFNEVEVLVSDGNGGNDTQWFSITVSNTNDAPTFISTPIAAGTEDMEYTYDVDATDMDIGDTLTYSLTTYPDTMTIDNATGVITWMPTNDDVGSNSVTVQVSDGNGGSETQSFTITVTNVNDLPTITSTPNMTAKEDSVYSYDVEADDVDVGDTLTYSLTVSPAGMTIDPVTGSITWTPINDQVGFNEVKVLVSDGNGGNDTQSFSITVSNTNDDPIFISTPIAAGTEEVEYKYDVNATDVDIGDTLFYNLTTYPDNMIIDSATGMITWTPTNDDVGSNSVTVQVTDGNGGSETQSFFISVSNVNDPPSIMSSPVITATQDILYTYEVFASDVDVGDTLTYSLTVYPIGMTIDSSTGEITWSPSSDQVGGNSVTVVVLDGKGGYDTQSFMISVANVNDPPTFTSQPITIATEEIEYFYEVEAIDIDGDTVTYSVLNYPNGMEIDSGNGTITWTPTNSQVGTHFIIVKVMDGNGGETKQSFTITVYNVNDPPTITSTPLLHATEEVTYAYNVQAEDIDPTDDVLTFELAVYPAGMQINSTTGIITWTPTNSQVGNNSVIVIVYDGNGQSDTQSFIINVSNVNDDPYFTSKPITEATEEEQYSYDVDAKDIDYGDTLIYSLTSAPDGMEIDVLTGFIYWTPQDADVGTHQIVVKVTDNQSAFATQSFTITVENVNDAPTMSEMTVEPTTGTNKEKYTFTLTYKDPDGDSGTVKVIINGVEHEMNKEGGDPVTGEVYFLQMSLGARNHTYYFEIDDGEGHLIVSNVSKISVTAAEVEEDEDEFPIPLWWIILILLIIILVVLAFLSRARSQLKRQKRSRDLAEYEKRLVMEHQRERAAPRELVQRAEPPKAEKRIEPEEVEEPEEEEEETLLEFIR